MLLTGALGLLAVPFFAQQPLPDTAADSSAVQTLPFEMLPDSVVEDTTETGGTGGTGAGGISIKTAWNWLLENWTWLLAAILGAWEFIARLTPSEKDNNLLRIVQSWLDRILPNRKKGGGSFAAYREDDDAPSIAYVKKRP